MDIIKVHFGGTKPPSKEYLKQADGMAEVWLYNNIQQETDTDGNTEYVADGVCLKTSLTEEQVEERRDLYFGTMTEERYAASKSADMTDADKMALLLSTLTEDKTNKGDNGEVLTKPVIKDGVIVYVDSGERLGSGTLEDPKQFVDGDPVTAGLYYCRCKVSAKGTIYRQLTSGTYRAYSTKEGAVWGKMTDFEPVA